MILTSLPGDSGGIKVQSHKLFHLLRCQRIRICLLYTKFLHGTIRGLNGNMGFTHMHPAKLEVRLCECSVLLQPSLFAHEINRPRRSISYEARGIGPSKWLYMSLFETLAYQRNKIPVGGHQSL